MVEVSSTRSRRSRSSNSSSQSHHLEIIPATRTINTTPALSRTTSRSFPPLAPSTQRQLSVAPPPDHSRHSHRQHNTSSQSNHLQIIPATRTVNTTPALSRTTFRSFLPLAPSTQHQLSISRTTSRSFPPLAPSTQRQLSVAPPSDHSRHSHRQHNANSRSVAPPPDHSRHSCQKPQLTSVSRSLAPADYLVSINDE